MRLFISLVILLLVSFALPDKASGTFSIIACDPETGACGVAVATNNLAVGSSVCYAVAGVGALVSQFETNPNYGPLGMRLLAQKIDIDDVLSHLLTHDNNFDGTDIESRQIALVNIHGQTVAHTGEHVLSSPWTGTKSGLFYSIQGNGLAGEHVVLAMEQTFQRATGTLAEQLMSALIAGQEAGGQTTGSMSAAILVRTVEGWPFDIDLRVDASKTPVDKLHRLLNFHYARQSIIQAERHARAGEVDQVWNAVAEALHRGALWDRIWRRAARLAIQLNEPERALEYLSVFKSLNSDWANQEILDDRYSTLRKKPLFRQWVLDSQ